MPVPGRPARQAQVCLYPFAAHLAFGSLALGSNRGLISLGLTTMIGVITVLLTSSFVLPYVWFRRNDTE